MKTRFVVGLALASSALGGCAGKEKPLSAAFRPAQLQTAPEAPARGSPVRVVELAMPRPLPEQLAPPSDAQRPSDRPAPKARVEAANRKSLLEPSSEAYLNAVQVYPWAEGAVYRLYAAPEQVSDIALERGETLIAVASGDTVRWIIGDTSSGSGTDRRTHVLVKPTEAGLKTNLLITTDRRTYHLRLESTAKIAMAAISWNYPQDELMALRRYDDGIVSGSGPSVDAADLRFRYAISGDRPSWRPLRAFDDGRQVFIEFPEGIRQAEAPPLFVLGADGGTELVNYRIQGRHYVVDKLFAAAELRMGKDPQQIVRIERTDSNGVRRRK